MSKLKAALKLAGCALLWLCAALSACLEGVLLFQIVSLEAELRRFGRAQNPYVAEDAWSLGVIALFNLVPLLFLLTLAVYCTSKLRRKKGPPCTPNS